MKQDDFGLDLFTIAMCYLGFIIFRRYFLWTLPILKLDDNFSLRNIEA